MADTKVSALAAVTVPALTDVLMVVQAATSKQETVQQILTLFLAQANSWNGLNTFVGATQIIRYDEDGAATGPTINLHRNSASPAVNDNIGSFRFDGEDSAGNQTQYASIVGQIIDPVDASEDGRLNFNTMVAGTSAQRMALAQGLFIGSQADPGVNNIAAAAYLSGGNQVVGARDTGWSAMTGAADEGTVYAVASVTLPQLAGRVMALQVALTTHGLIGA